MNNIQNKKIISLLKRYFVSDLIDDIEETDPEEIESYSSELDFVINEVDYILNDRYLDTGTYTGLDVAEALKVKEETKNFKEFPLIIGENLSIVKEKYSDNEIKIYKGIIEDLNNLKKLKKELEKL